MLERVLIANRGEAAVRLVRACHDLGIEAVAVYSTADKDGLWVDLADRAVCIGPHQAAESYLKVSNLIAAAETTGCDAVHPGWGFLAENAGFVRACNDNDLIFVGPSPQAIELMGDKSMAKQTMRESEVPLVPGGEDRLEGVAEAAGLAADVGYPVLLKAAAGGGGRGMRLVESRGARGGLPHGQRRGAGGLRRRRLPREGGAGSPPRRDAGAGRRPRRGAGAGRARLLGPAAPPEAGRGGPVPGAR